MFPPEESTFSLIGTLEGGNVSQTVTPAPGTTVLLDCGLRAVGILKTFQPTPTCESSILWEFFLKNLKEVLLRAGIPGTPHLIRDFHENLRYSRTMAGLARVVAPGAPHLVT